MKMVALVTEQIVAIQLLIEEEILDIEKRVRIWKNYRTVPDSEYYEYLIYKKNQLLMLSKTLAEYEE